MLAPHAGVAPDRTTATAVSADLLAVVSAVSQLTSPSLIAERRKTDQPSYRDFLDALGVAVYTTNVNGQITFFNEAAAAFWGREPALGEKWCGSWKLYWPDGRPMRHDECPMAVCLRENRAVRGGSAIAQRPDGSRVQFIPYPSPCGTPTGALVGAVNVLVDVTGTGPHRRGAARHCRCAARLERGQGRVPRPRLARAADASHHDLRQRPAPA